MLVFGEADFHAIGIDFDAREIDRGPVERFACFFGEAKEIADKGKERIVAAKREKIVKVMHRRLVEDMFEDPVQRFGKEIEKQRGGCQAEWEEHVGVILPQPVED
jgi:hypothetical protein